MKTILLSFAFIAMTAVAHAQNQVLIYGGPQVTSARYTIKGEAQAMTPKYGFQLGAGLKVPFENHLYFAPTAFYSLKGYNVKFNQPSTPPDATATSNSTSIHTLEVAALLQFDFSMKTQHVYFKAGPALDFQLSGQETYIQQDKTQVTQPMKYGFNNYGRVGANLMLETGYETRSGYLFAARLSHGVGSVNNTDDGPIILHESYGFTIGKYLHRK